MLNVTFKGWVNLHLERIKIMKTQQLQIKYNYRQIIPQFGFKSLTEGNHKYFISKGNDTQIAPKKDSEASLHS